MSSKLESDVCCRLQVAPSGERYEGKRRPGRKQRRLLLGIWRDSLHVTCGLIACTPGSAPGPTLGNEYGKTLPFTFYLILLLYRGSVGLGRGVGFDRRRALRGSRPAPRHDLPVSRSISQLARRQSPQPRVCRRHYQTLAAAHRLFCLQ